MAKRLILMRHSKALQPTFNQSDHSRQLSEKGINRARIVGERLQSANYSANIALVSDSDRTQETFQIVAPYLGLSKDMLLSKPSLYLSGLEDYFDELEALPNEFNSVVLIAHNPTISMLVSQLLKSRYFEMAPGSTCVLDCQTELWLELPQAKCELVEFINAKALG